MKRTLTFLVVLSALLVINVATLAAPVPVKDYSAFMSSQPKSILVIPVINRGTDANAPNIFLSTIPVPLAENGYYIFPINLVKRVLEDNGLSDADMVYQAPAPTLAQMFGADAVLYACINEWSVKWLITTTATTVDSSFILKDGRTGETLWQDRSKAVYNMQSSSSSGNPLADLIAQAIVSAISAGMKGMHDDEYFRLAQMVNGAAFAYPGKGFPPGHYKAKQESVNQQNAQNSEAEASKNKELN